MLLLHAQFAPCCARHLAQTPPLWLPTHTHAGLHRLTALQQLDLSENPMLSDVDAAATLPPSLTALQITGCGLHRLPTGLAALSRLKELFLSANEIVLSSDGSSEWLQLLQLPALVHVGLAFNRISTIPAAPSPAAIEAAAASCLMSLDLSHNDLVDLRGTIQSLALLPRLRALVLRGNPCALLPSYRAATLSVLRRLTYLDGASSDAAAAAGSSEPAGGGLAGSSSSRGSSRPGSSAAGRPDGAGGVGNTAGSAAAGELSPKIASPCESGGTHLLLELTGLSVSPSFISQTFESLQRSMADSSRQQQPETTPETAAASGEAPPVAASGRRTSSAGGAAGKAGGRRASSAANERRRSSSCGPDGSSAAVADQLPALPALHFYLEFTSPEGWCNLLFVARMFDPTMHEPNHR